LYFKKNSDFYGWKLCKKVFFKQGLIELLILGKKGLKYIK